VAIIVVVNIVDEFKVKRNFNMITLFFPKTKIKFLGTHWFCRDGRQQYTYPEILKLLMEIICRSLKSIKGLNPCNMKNEQRPIQGTSL
jgi:hypothetical protein